MREAPLFLDTEFTSFGGMELVSIGVVTLDGQEFYAETSDHDVEDRSDFVQRVVVPLLEGGEVSMPHEEIARRLVAWIEGLAGQQRIVCDYAGDWKLFCELMPTIWPGNLVGEQLVWSYGMVDGGPMELREAKRRAWKAAEDHFTREPRHHALHDARAMRAAWIAEQAESEAPRG